MLKSIEALVLYINPDQNKFFILAKNNEL